jgi:Rap1a immunity proteins
MRFLMLALAFLGFAAGRASAQQSDPYSAAALVSACRSYIENSVLPEPEVAFKEGVCVGIFSAMLGFAPMFDPSIRFCVPRNVTSRQAMQAVIRGLESQPDLLREDLRNVIVSVLRYTWPCAR